MEEWLKKYGGVAQLARACGSYPQGPGFKSLRRHQTKNIKLRFSAKFFCYLAGIFIK